MANDDWGLQVLEALNRIANSPSHEWDQSVNYAGLPAASTCAGSTWLVLQGTGVWPANKPSGWYYSDGATWFYLGSYNPVITGGNVVVSNFPAVQAVNGTVSVGNFPVSQPVTGTFWQATQPISGTVSVGNFPATQPISGSVSVSNFPASQAVTGTFWQTTQPISGAVTVSNFPATQPVSGSISVSNFPATQAVTGTFWQVTQPISVVALPLPSGAATEATLALIKAKTDNLDVLLSTRTKPADTQTISGAVTVSNFPSTQAVTGTFWQATQPISGAVSVSNFPASQAVTGTFWPATQPISGSVSVSNFPVSQAVTGTFWQVTQPISGSVSVSNFPATQPVSLASVPLPTGASTEATLALIKAKTDNIDVLLSTRTKPADTQAVSGSVSVSNFPATQPVSGTVSTVEDRTSGRALVMKTGTLVTTAITADQVVLTYTVTAGKTFFLEYLTVMSRLTAISATASIMGTISLETPSGTKTWTVTWINPTVALVQPIVLTLGEPLPIAAGTVIRIVCTPAAVTSMTWIGNFGGYEK